MLISASVIVVATMIIVVTRYRPCPADKILVVYGHMTDGGCKVSRGEGAFVAPFIQDCAYLDLTPFNVDITLEGALTRDKRRVNSQSTFTLGVSTDPDLMQAAAERLLRMPQDEISGMCRDVIAGETRRIVGRLGYDELDSRPEQFCAMLREGVSGELGKIGIEVIDFDVSMEEGDDGGFIRRRRQTM